MTSSGRKSQYLSKTDDALEMIYDNAEHRQELQMINQEFLRLLKQEAIQQFMRRRYSSSDPT